MRCVSECYARLYYLDGTVCSFGTCQAFAATQVANRATAAHSSASAADGADEAERCYFVESVLGVRECEPKQLSATKRRAEVLDEAYQDIAYDVCGLFGVSEADADRADYDTRSCHHALDREHRQADRERHAEDQRGAVDARRQHLEARQRRKSVRIS